MRLSILSAALCGLVFVPRAVSQGTESGSGVGAPICGNGTNFNCQEDCEPNCSVTTGRAAATELGGPLQSGGNAAETASGSTAQSTLEPAGDSTPKASKNISIGPIVGGVVGGILFLALIGALAFFLVRRRRRSRSKDIQNQEVAVFKSRASSPTSHAAVSPIYSTGTPAVPSQPQLQYQPQPQPQGVALPPPPPPPPPGPPVSEPVELLSREIDDDGVSVSSFDMARPWENTIVPRLPVDHRGTPPGGSTTVL